MNNLLKKLGIVSLILIIVNIIGFAYHTNYIGAVVGSVIGAITGFFISEIRAKFD